MSSPTDKQMIFSVSKLDRNSDSFEKSLETSKDAKYRTIWTSKVKNL